MGCNSSTPREGSIQQTVKNQATHLFNVTQHFDQSSEQPRQGAFDVLKEDLRKHGDTWKPTAWYEPKGTMGKITDKRYFPSMTFKDLQAIEKFFKPMPNNEDDEYRKYVVDIFAEVLANAKKCEGRPVALPYILVLHTSKWNVQLDGTGETVPDVPYHELDFTGAPPKLTATKSDFKVPQNRSPCHQRGYCCGKCNICKKDLSMLPGAMTSALVDGFSGPMEVAITSCIGLPRTWNFNAGLAETCGLCFCCYFLPHNMQWFEVWAANVMRDALVGKSEKTRFCVAVTYDDGHTGNFMQKMELPFTYLYGLEVLLVTARDLRKAFVETGLWERTVEFVTGSDDGTVRKWSDLGKQLGGTMEVGETVCCVDITHEWIFAGDFKGNVHKYHRADCTLSCKKDMHSGREVRSLVVSGGVVFTGGKDGIVKMSDIENLDVIKSFKRSELNVGEVQCIAVSVLYFFAGGDKGALRLNHQATAAQATPIQPREEPEVFQKGISHMALNGRSLFMSSKADDKGQVYFLRDSYFMPDGALTSKIVFTAKEPVRSLALGGSHLFVATRNAIYKLDARKPDQTLAAIDVTALHSTENSHLKDFAVYGEIAVAGYFPGSPELGIFHMKTCDRVKLKDGAFTGHKNSTNCVAVG